ncbi:MAG: DNA internalization-related competence protein ComEC/Rec2 [Eubacterium sp.]|nr:DNA internalization-related competence protein ComEC/Rec2 [Eubacterium sp.]
MAILICLYFKWETLIFTGVFAVVIFIWTLKHLSQMSRLMLLMMAAVFCLGAVNSLMHKAQMESQQFKNIQDEWSSLTGTVVMIEENENQTICLVRRGIVKTASERLPVKGIYVYLDKEKMQRNTDVQIGDLVFFKGRFSAPQKSMNEGEFDAENYYKSKKINGFLFQSVCVRRKAGFAPIRQGLYRLRIRWEQVYERILPQKEASLAKGMILGQKKQVDETMKELYVGAGIAHLLAISGLHISMIGSALRKVLRKMRLKGNWADMISLVFVALYIVMIGGGATSVRAGIMYGVMLLAPRLNKAYDMLTALAISAFVELIYNPYLLGSISFLFSYLAILGIVWIGKPLVHQYRKSFKRRKGSAQRWKDTIVEGLCMSASIQVMLLPLQMYTYYEISIWTIVLNVAVLPLSGYLIGDLFIAAIAGSFLWQAGVVVAMVGRGILWVYEKLCVGSSAVTGSNIITGKPSLCLVLVIYLILITLGAMIRYSKVRQLAIVGGCYGVCMLGTVRMQPSFELDVLYVGQGDGIFLRTDRAHTLFIDGGSTSEDEIGKRTILPFLKSKKITQIDYWFVSHGDEDHISGLKYAIAAGYPIRHLVLAKMQKDQEAIKDLAALATEYEIPVVYLSQGQRLQWEDTKITVVYPGDDANQSDANESCLGLKISDGDFDGLFLGDLGTEQEEEIAAQYDLGQLEFFKVDHHGSKYSNSEILLEEIMPRIACVSYGEHNRYGHPHQEAMQRIAAYAGKIHETAKSGQFKMVY